MFRAGGCESVEEESINTDVNWQMETTKGFCEDLTEGKFSLPVIHSIRNSASSNNELINILKLHTEDRTLKAYALQYMQTRTKSLEHSRYVLSLLHEQAETTLRQIQGQNHQMATIMARMKLDRLRFGKIVDRIVGSGH